MTQFNPEYKTLINTAYLESLIDKDTYEYLNTQYPEIQPFTHYPRFIKNAISPLGQPIVSGIGSLGCHGHLRPMDTSPHWVQARPQPAPLAPCTTRHPSFSMDGGRGDGLGTRMGSVPLRSYVHCLPCGTSPPLCFTGGMEVSQGWSGGVTRHCWVLCCLTSATLAVALVCRVGTALFMGGRVCPIKLGHTEVRMSEEHTEK